MNKLRLFVRQLIILILLLTMGIFLVGCSNPTPSINIASSATITPTVATVSSTIASSKVARPVKYSIKFSDGKPITSDALCTLLPTEQIETVIGSPINNPVPTPFASVIGCTFKPTITSRYPVLIVALEDTIISKNDFDEYKSYFKDAVVLKGIGEGAFQSRGELLLAFYKAGICLRISMIAESSVSKDESLAIAVKMAQILQNKL